MEDRADDTDDWQKMRARIHQLESENINLGSLGWLTVVLNVLILVGALYWHAQPRYVYRVERLTVSTLHTDTIGTPFAPQRTELRRRNVDQQNYVRLLRTYLRSDGDPPAAGLEMFTRYHGMLALMANDAPYLSIWSETGPRPPKPDWPQISLWLDGPDQPPRIVLRDAKARVIWSTP